ncbi:hypothetical protein G6F37_011866 [Rhizopus arrhizus]|nr:hypothetical protein G6F38_013018 [Rhizopus arrhizus]KAG1146950.1 hypothetical protein G6F37_011866 [Rhizopus arrhizus]
MEEIAEELATESVAGRKYNVYSDKQKAIEPRTAQKRAKRSKEDPSWNIYKKQTNQSNRKPSQLQKEHKHHLANSFDKYLQATRRNAVESLTEAFEGFSLKETSVGNFILYEYNLTVKRATLQPLAINSVKNLENRYQRVKKWVETTDMNYLTNCVFVDEAGFNINMRSPNTRSIRGTPAVVEALTTRAVTHTIVGAITAQDVISVEIREPLKPKKG